MNRLSKKKICILDIFLSIYILIVFIIGINVDADLCYDISYQDPAGDVLEFNETWSNNGQVDSQQQIDIKWLRSSNDTLGNVILRLEFKNNQIIEKSNNTRYVLRIFTSQDNSTGYNITYINDSCTISNFNNTFQEDMTINTSIINDQGEVIVVIVSKEKYLNNITYYNIDAFTWKEQGNYTYIDYVSEIPGHPGETGTVVDQEDGESEDKGIFDLICSFPLILIMLAIIIIIVIIVILKR